jgi:ABC-type amino acid transport substrate-binding protein
MAATKKASLCWIVWLCALIWSAPVLGDEGRTRLKAAVLEDFPPQYGLAADGTPEGFAIDVISEIALLADVDLTFIIKKNWAEMFAALRSGEADLIPNLGITQRRKEWFAFTAPVETFPVHIFVRSASEKIDHLADLTGRRVGVVRLNAGERLMSDHKAITAVVFEDVKDALFDLLSGSIDAMVYPKPVLQLLAKRAGLADHIVAVGEPLVEIKRAISVRKDHQALLRQLDEAVARFVESPAYERIYTKWYGKPPPLMTIRQLALLMAVAFVLIVLAMAWWRYRSLLRINVDLARSVEERRRAEEKLQEAHDRLEERVHERTLSLAESNTKLRTEIHRRTEAESRLREKERFLASVFDSIQDGICVLTPDLTIAHTNRTMQKWYAEHLPLEGKKCFTVYRGGQRHCRDCPAVRCLDSRGLEMREVSLIQEGVESGVLEVYAFPMLGEDDHITGIVEYFRDVTATKLAEQEREMLIADLKKALAKVRTLSGLLPICAKCKKIRDDRGYWSQIETYLSQHADVDFSHGLCPDCMETLYSGQIWYEKNKGGS